MKTKAQIVQELLEEKKITAEDAVILLMGESKVEPNYPKQINPYYPPWIVTCGSPQLFLD